jgi:hypothetical protein
MDCEFTIADGEEDSKVAIWQISTREKVMDFLNYFFPPQVCLNYFFPPQG